MAKVNYLSSTLAVNALCEVQSEATVWLLQVSYLYYSFFWRLKITESLLFAVLVARLTIFRTLKFCKSKIVGAVSILCVISPLKFGCLSCFCVNRKQPILKKHLQEVCKHQVQQRWPLLKPNLASCQVPKTYVWFKDGSAQQSYTTTFVKQEPPQTVSGPDCMFPPGCCLDTSPTVVWGLSGICHILPGRKQSVKKSPKVPKVKQRFLNLTITDKSRGYF